MGRGDGDDDRGGEGDDGSSGLPKLIKRALQLLAFALVVEFLVLPQLGGARRALELVGDINPLFVGLAVALQVCTYLAHAQLTRALIPEDTRPSLQLTTRIELSSRAVSHVVPGGTAPGAALAFRLLQRSGVKGADAGFASGTQAIGAALVLHTLVWLTLAVSIPLRGFHPFYQGAAVAGAGLVGGFAALVFALTKGKGRAARIVGSIARKVPFLDDEQAVEVVHRLADRLEEVAKHPWAMARAVGWAAAHWISDAGSLWLFLAAFGEPPPIDVLIVAFGIGSMLATIPITPRGLGVFEGAVIALLVAFGLPRAEAILGVVTYRLVNFWLPIPIGAASYVSVEASLSGKRKPVRSALESLAHEVTDHAKSVRDWARERGLRWPGS